MKLKLSKILTSVVIVLVASTASSNQCVETTLGEYQKTLWGDSISDSLRGELVNQLEKKDDLFEDLTPEFEIGLAPKLDLNFKFQRAVKKHLPMPNDLFIASDDYLTYKVQNKLHLEFKSNFEAGIFFADSGAGLNLVHSSDHLPGKESDPCALYQIILDMRDDRAKDIYDGICTTRHKSKFTAYYDVAIKFLSQKTAKLFDSFVDSDKNVKFAEDPLAALRLHSLLGVPIDYRIFLENNADIAIGDVIEHTTFFNIKPLGLKVDLFGFLRPSHSRFRRHFRSLGFKKIEGDKVIVEIEDTQISGDGTEFFKLRPKLFDLIKINLGKWGKEDFKEESLLQRFEIDLKADKGIEFFKKILLAAYTPKLKLHRNSILIDHRDYEGAVSAFSPIYRDGYGSDNLFVIRIPGAIKYENRSYYDINRVHFEGNDYLTGEKLLRRKFRNKLHLDFWIFEIKKKDKNYECRLDLQAKSIDHNSSMNIECNYYNRYAENRHIEDIRQSLEMTLDGKMDRLDQDILQSLLIEDTEKVSMYSNISFSKKQIDNITSSSEEEIIHEIAKLLFGDGAKNVFSKKYRRNWIDMRRFQFDNLSTADPRYTKCGIALAEFGIIEDYEIPYYSKFLGNVGRGRGLHSYDTQYCFNYYRLAKELVRDIRKLADRFSDDDVEDVLDILDDLEKSGLVQNLLVRLAGGIGRDKVRYNYVVSSPRLAEPVMQTNGVSYNAGLPSVRRSILEDLNDEFFPRIKKISYKMDDCRPGQLKVAVELYYMFDEVDDINFNLEVKTSSYKKEHIVHEEIVNASSMKEIDELNYEYTFDLGKKYDPTLRYNIYLKLLNKDGLHISEESKSFVRRLNTLK